MTKTCAKCQLSVPVGEFYRYKSGTPYRYCKACHKARTAKWHRANPNVTRSSRWRHKYGIDLTVEQYDEMHDLQAGLCKICGRAESASGRRLAVDHDHETGAIRGLLCTKCNTTVGWVELHPGLLTYLNEHSKGVVPYVQ